MLIPYILGGKYTHLSKKRLLTRLLYQGDYIFVELIDRSLSSIYHCVFVCRLSTSSREIFLLELLFFVAFNPLDEFQRWYLKFTLMFNCEVRIVSL